MSAALTPDWVRMMAGYNAWQNGAVAEAAAGLDDRALAADRGAFFGSILGTLSHLLWADRIWLARLADAPPPDCPGADSPRYVTTIEDWAARRRDADAELVAWADAMTELPAEVRWHSGILGREVARPGALVVTHVFNHQTHHRGQVHAMLTAAGARPDDTDLIFMPAAPA
jgi:uncharacterized damage-inducible protein DinB